jgi:hypothetical protein
MPKRTPHREVIRLMNDLREWCEAEYGRQTEIAKILGVDRQRVSDWLAYRAFPSLGTGLQLYHFLQHEKARKADRPVEEGNPTQKPS